MKRQMAGGSSAVAVALMRLSETFLDEGHFLQAIKCLEAIAQSHVSFAPADEAAARVRCAEVLMAFTDCMPMATEHLTRAKLLLGGVAGHLPLKLAAASGLGRCHRAAGDVAASAAALKWGLAALDAAPTPPPDASPWSTHLRLESAATHVAMQAFDDAARCVAASHAASCDAGDWVAAGVASLAAAGIACLDLQTEVVMTCVTRAEEEARRAGDGPAATALLSHCSLLVAVDAARRGDHPSLTAALATLDGRMGGQPAAALTALGIASTLACPVSVGGDGHVNVMATVPWGAITPRPPPAYGWLPGPLCDALVSLLRGAACRPEGPLPSAQGHLATALESLNSMATHAGLAPTTKDIIDAMVPGRVTPPTPTPHPSWSPAVVETELPPRKLVLARVILLLRGAALEAASLVMLTRGDPASAAPVISATTRLQDDYPTLLVTSAASAASTAGHYALAVGAPLAAARHFRSAAECESCDPRRQVTPAACEALAMYHASREAVGGASAACLSAALDILLPHRRVVDATVPHGSAQASGAAPAGGCTGLTPCEEASLSFVLGCVAASQGDAAAAKQRLGRSLALGHSTLHSYSLVAQSLSALAGVHTAEGAPPADTANLVRSALVLAKSLHDATAMVAASGAMATAVEAEAAATGMDAVARRRAADRAAKLHAVEAETRAGLGEAAHAAAAGPHHAALLAWGPPTQAS